MSVARRAVYWRTMGIFPCRPIKAPPEAGVFARNHRLQRVPVHQRQILVERVLAVRQKSGENRQTLFKRQPLQRRSQMQPHHRRGIIHRHLRELFENFFLRRIAIDKQPHGPRADVVVGDIKLLHQGIPASPPFTTFSAHIARNFSGHGASGFVGNVQSATVSRPCRA